VGDTGWAGAALRSKRNSHLDDRGNRHRLGIALDGDKEPRPAAVLLHVGTDTPHDVVG
jgi:hypothetical protein